MGAVFGIFILKTSWSDLLAGKVKGWPSLMLVLIKEKYESQAGFDWGCRLGLPWSSSGRKGTILGVSLMGFELLLYIVKTWEMDLPGLMVAWSRGGEMLRFRPWAWVGFIGQ